MQTKGIDVSTWQGIIDWPRAKASGVDFAMLRASYGWMNKDKQTDSQFCRNMKEAKAAGVACGAYHYSYATTVEEAKKEAAFFLDIIKGYSFEYPLAFDMEDGCQKNLGRELLTSIAYAFLEEVEKAGYYVCLYTNLDWIKNRLDMGKLSRFDLWLAQWNTSPTYEGNFGIWQYTSKGNVPGIDGNVDMDLSYKDYPAIMKDRGLNGFMAGKPSVPEQKPDSGDIKVGDKVRVKSGAKTYDGGGLASFVYNTTYTVIETKGDRVVIGLNGVVTAAVKASDLYLDGSGPAKVLEVGAKVRITGNVYTNGAAIPGWVKESTYTVSQMTTGRVLLKEIISWVPIDGVEVI